jgi:group II intron reverse transcriptase/maturase
MPGVGLTSLSHHIDMDWMHEAFRRTRKDGAAGVDGQTAREYEQGLQEKLQELLDRAKTGAYRAPPVRRVHIPKGSGEEMRPIGIPTFEDKVLQRAVVMALEAVYEQDFLDCSYGYRPGRSAHQALDALWQGLMAMGGGWVLEVDFRRFFDMLDHTVLRRIVRQRVRDGVLLRLIGKWLNAGVQEGLELSYPSSGTPQGGVISPLLANIYLHEVVDVWVEHVVRPRLNGRAFMVRFADDLVMVFSDERDARRVMDVLPKRSGKYGLTLHPAKTHLVPYRPVGGVGPGAFDFLGFTHYWRRSRRGWWVVARKTAGDRFSRGLKRISEWCRRNRHAKIPEQHAILSQKLKGHFGYYGITGNSNALVRFRWEVQRIWRKWLGTRSWKAPRSWQWFNLLLKRHPLPPAVAVHSVLRAT